MKSQKFYERALRKYFDANLLRYAKTAEWSVDPVPNQWKFDIPELGIEVNLVCADDGTVKETRTPLK